MRHETSARCPLCHEPAPHSAHLHERDYLSCEQCRLVFVPRRQHLPPQEERRRYLQHDNTMENEGYVQMFRDLFPYFERHWDGVASVLDYGCGPGPVLVELLRREGYDAVGYDPYFAPDADLDRTYDSVVSTETFEHLADVRRELDTIDALLPSGGCLTVMTQWLPSWDDWHDWYYLRDETHVTFYTADTFVRIAAEYDYDVLCQAQGMLTILRKR